MKRRQFLAAAAVGAVPASVAPAPAAPPPGRRERIGIGFLGAAHSHAFEKVKAVLESPDFELVGVCEEAAPVRERHRELGVAFLGLDDLLARSRVIAVESAVRDHARHAKIAVDAGKHVHIEKPPAATLREFREIAAVAREKKLALQVGYMWRHNPGFTAIVDAARAGWLGDVFLVRAALNTSLARERRPEWAEFRGGVMFELGSHVTDAIVRLLGRPRSVTPFLARHGRHADDCADNTMAVFEFERALGVISSSTLHPNAFPHRSFEVIGTNGVALLKPIEPPTVLFDLGKAAGPYGAGTTTQAYPYRRYVEDLEELAAAARGERPLSVTLDEELLIHETLIRASRMEL